METTLADTPPSEELAPPSSSSDPPADPYLVQRQALRAAAREAALQDELRRPHLPEQPPNKSPNKSPNKITRDSSQSAASSSGDPTVGITAEHPSPPRSFAVRVAAPAFTAASAKTWGSTYDPARRGREFYEQLEEASDGLRPAMDSQDHWTSPRLALLGASQSERSAPTSGTVTPTASSTCGSTVSEPVRSSFGPATRMPTSSRLDAARASAATGQGGKRRGKGGTPRRCPGLGTPTRRGDACRFDDGHHAAPRGGGAATPPCRHRGDGRPSVGSPLNSPGPPVGFVSSLSPSRVLMAASPVRPTAGRWLDDVLRQGSPPSTVYPKSPYR